MVAALRAHPGNAGVQEKGCLALKHMTLNADNKAKAGAAGAIEAVVAALKAHPGNAVVQEKGCTALTNMTTNADNQATAGAAGAIEAVVAALKAHPGNAGVQERGCSALNNICFLDAALQRRARVVGAVALLRAAAANHPHGGEVKRYAEKALRKILVDTPSEGSDSDMESEPESSDRESD